jgi:hypothetical protein
MRGRNGLRQRPRTPAVKNSRVADAADQLDICGQPDPLTGRPHLEEARRAALGHRMQTLLSHAGVPAKLTAVGGSPVDFTVTYSRDDESLTLSAVLSVLTIGVVPGYSVERKTLDIDLAPIDGAHDQKTEHLRYQARTQRLLWLPLIFSPDFLWPGDWESAKSRNGGFTQMVERLAEDIRTRRGGPDEPIPVTVKVVCPVAESQALTEGLRSLRNSTSRSLPRNLSRYPGSQP